MAVSTEDARTRLEMLGGLLATKHALIAIVAHISANENEAVSLTMSKLTEQIENALQRLMKDIDDGK